jgi:hypothetical protein
MQKIEGPAGSAAAHEMNDFEPGAGLKGAAGPLGPLQDLPIHLDGDLPGVKAERLDEPQDGLTVGDVALLAIQENPHRTLVDRVSPARK